MKSMCSSEHHNSLLCILQKTLLTCIYVHKNITKLYNQLSREQGLQAVCHHLILFIPWKNTFYYFSNRNGLNFYTNYYNKLLKSKWEQI